MNAELEEAVNTPCSPTWKLPATVEEAPETKPPSNFARFATAREDEAEIGPETVSEPATVEEAWETKPFAAVNKSWVRNVAATELEAVATNPPRASIAKSVEEALF